MKLSLKMSILFSVMMFAALLILASYAGQRNVDGANTMTESRFSTMSAMIQSDLERDISTMEMTMNELTGSLSFSAALNQFVRDDSTDNKVGLAASKAVQQQYQQSPLVDNYYRVSFYTREGRFVTNRTDKDSTLISGTQEAAELFSSLPWLDAADGSSTYILLSPHEDVFSAHSGVQVYGIVQKFLHHGQCIGYLEISQECTSLDRLQSVLDNPTVNVQVLFENGDLLYSSTSLTLTWPEDFPLNTYMVVDNVEGDIAYTALHKKLSSQPLHIYIGQDSKICQEGNRALIQTMFKYTLIIMIPTVVLIFIVSLGMTRSIRRLTRKMTRLPSDSALRSDSEVTQSLTSMVTTSRDDDIYLMESAFNTLMLRLRESTAKELSLREGTLQARLSALQTQINPHFIYNTLNIISAKAMESGSFEIIEICGQFAQMLRYSTDTNSRTATLAEEIDNVRNYLLLAKARYEDNLEYTIDVPENAQQIQLPKLTLQPLVENALTHGFNGQNEQRRLSITGEVLREHLSLEIRDNGVGFSDDVLISLRTRLAEITEGHVAIETNGGHIGLINTCLRLHYYSQGKVRIGLRNENGAVVSLSIPLTGLSDEAQEAGQ